MNTTNKILFAALLAATTSTSFAKPHTQLASAADVSTQAVQVQAEYPANQVMLEQINRRQQHLIERLEADNQIEFNQRVDLDGLHEPLDTHSVNK